MKRKSVDLLVEQFWKNGYLTVRRKFGTYLPEPAKVGNFDVDIIARYKDSYAIGLTLTKNDMNNAKIKEKIIFLATRQTRFTNKQVKLFIGADETIYKNAKALIEILDNDVKKNIRLFQIIDRPVEVKRKHNFKEKVLFS
ncbi:MAG TPA: hypothetical protein VLM39_07370 [Ignavibacteriaceae bacterium]|nr:hypothetical protein [Ignavibacteriaceae bacterium]